MSSSDTLFPLPALPARFTLHVARAGDLPRLGQTMDNCLASYGRRTDGRDRIVEVREDGRTVYAVYIHDGRIKEFEAPGNRPPRREDVPVVRELIEAEGHLAETRASPSRQMPSSSLRGPQPRPHPPAARAVGVSAQELATAMLRGSDLNDPEWPEVAAAMWAVGILSTMPEPEQVHYAQLVDDLAELLATGQIDALPACQPPSPDQRVGMRRNLIEAADLRTWAGHQRIRMANVLRVPVRP